MKLIFCKVKGCRFPSSHVTISHECGTCNYKGHGQLECRDSIARKKCERYWNDILPSSLHCQVPGCQDAIFHTTEGHLCDTCMMRGNNCKCIQESSIQCPTCKTINIIEQNTVFTGNDCIICYESKPMVLFKTCRHANICQDCADKLKVA